MTTGNKIVTKTISDVIYVPLESVQPGSDSIPFVYLRNGSKQIVVLGESNENNVIIEQGIEPGIQLYLNTPEKPEEFTKLLGENLISIIKEKEKAKKEEERRINEQSRRGGFGGRGDMMNMTPEMRQQFQNMRGNNPQGAMRGDSTRRRNFTQGQSQGQRSSGQEGRPAQQQQEQQQQQPAINR
jgi:hypothetical protein